MLNKKNPVTQYQVTISLPGTLKHTLLTPSFVSSIFSEQICKSKTQVHFQSFTHFMAFLSTTVPDYILTILQLLTKNSDNVYPSPF